MTVDIAKVKATATRAFADTFANINPAWRSAVRVYTDDAPTLELGAYIGAGTYGAAAGSAATAEDIDSVKSIISATHKDQLYTVDWDDIRDSLSLVENISRILANEADKTLYDIVEAGILALPSTAHPLRNDRGVGPAINFADTGINYGGPLAGTTQDNLLTMSFSRNAVKAAIKMLREYRNQSGMQLNLGQQVNLLVGPENEDEAYAIANSAMSSDQMQSSVLPQRVAGVAVMPGLGNDWAVVDAEANPLVLHLRGLPEIVVREKDTGLAVNFSGKLSATFGLMPSEAGLIYSQVA